MRRLNVLLIAIIITVLGLPAMSAAQDIKITDYDVPVSRAHELSVNGSFLLAEDEQYDSRNQYYTLSGRWLRYFNSLPFAWSTDLYGNLWGERYNDRPLVFEHHAEFRGSIHKYLTDESIFYGGASTRVLWDGDYDRPDVDVGLAVGIGRYVIATALAQALSIDRFLIDENILPGHMPNETLLELASVIDRYDEYKTRYRDTYLVRWYEDMERAILSEADLPGGTVGPIGVMRMRDALERERVYTRAHGWKVECGINIPTVDPRDSDPGDPWPYVQASLAYPIGLGQQLQARVWAQTDVDNNFGRLYQLEASAEYTFEVSNRIDVQISDDYRNERLRRSSGTGSTERTIRGNQLDVSLYYYLENRISLNWRAGLAHSYTRLHRSDGELRIYNYRRWQFDFSVSYHVF